MQKGVSISPPLWDRLWKWKVPWTMLASVNPDAYVKLLRRIQKIMRAPKKDAEPADSAIIAENGWLLAQDRLEFQFWS